MGLHKGVKCSGMSVAQDGEEEAFKDLAEEDEEEGEEDADEPEDGAETEEVKPAASWVHHQNLEGV